MSAPNTANAGEFLVELEESEGFSALQNCLTAGSELILRNESDPSAVAAKMSSFADQKVFLETTQVEKLSTFKGLTSIKFFIGTEVYFVKTPLEVVDQKVCFEQSAKVVQLRRRKEPRYNIPEKWNQISAIWSIELKLKNEGKVTDISNGGCRYEIPNLTLELKKGDKIRLQYQIFKRAVVVCDGIIRFIMRKSNGTTILGLEFVDLQKGNKARIDNIVEDLINHYTSKNLL